MTTSTEHRVILVRLNNIEDTRRVFDYLNANGLTWCTRQKFTLPEDIFGGRALSQECLCLRLDHPAEYYPRGIEITHADIHFFRRATPMDPLYREYCTATWYHNVNDFIESNVINDSSPGCINQFAKDPLSFVPDQNRHSELISMIRDLLEVMPYDLDEEVADVKKRAKDLIERERR